MIQLPETTYYGKRMPKEKFYSHLEVSAAVKRSFVDDVDYFVWRNKLAPTTANLEMGDRVKEIALFEVRLKREEYNPTLFEYIDRNVPVYVVYLLRFEGNVRLLASYKEPSGNKSGVFRIVETFVSDWMPENDIDLFVDGLNLDSIYENFVRQIAGNKLKSAASENLVVDIEAEQRRAKIERQIAQLEAKRRNEKQFNRQMELSAEIKKLKEQI
ncbi:Methyl-accepting chemotaxis protein [Mucinivorans hirudinis]|uniref:Methyl-accepting chemotaxis protein n=1 Tax=Mucinivorans hirudinis TaxID=1433126 RepID=A0A060RBM1_9BACT|nr:Methyl-accepting chemotaxis protein [Mucinivorans hirudinis]